MNIDITSRGFTPSSDLIELINTKVEKLSKFDKNISLKETSSILNILDNETYIEIVDKIIIVIKDFILFISSSYF